MAEATAQEQLHSAFSTRTKVFVVIMAAVASVFSPLASTIYLPALNTLAANYHVTSASINLTVTIYIIFQGLSPMFFGDLADRSGRRPVYILAFTVAFFANLGLALQDNYAALFVLRAMQASGSSVTVAIGNGVVADVVTSAERGSYIGWVQAGTNFGPALAPVIGGLLAQFLGWRAIFWFLLICGAVYLSVYIIFVPETGRDIVGNGSIPPRSINKSVVNCLRSRKDRMKNSSMNVPNDGSQHTGNNQSKLPRLRFPNPTKALRMVIEKDVAIVLFIASLLITLFQCLMTTLPSLFNEIYGLNDLQVGLCYLPFSFGAMAGSILAGRALDYNYKRVARKIGVSVDRKRGNELRNFPIERARLEVACLPLVLSAGLTSSWGWILRARPSLAAPLVVFFIIGFFNTASFTMLSTLVVDLYPHSPATATAALNLVRCLIAAVGVAVIQHIINAMGLGWAYTFLALLSLAVYPSLLIVIKWGPKWREQRFLKASKHKEKKQQRQAEESENVSQDQGGGSGEKDLEAGASGSEDQIHSSQKSEPEIEANEKSAVS